MKKLLLILAISVSAVMADVSPKDDLLSVATAGKTTGTQFEMSKEDMQKAEGGYYSSYITYTNPYSSYYRGTSRSYIYARAFLGL